MIRFFLLLALCFLASWLLAQQYQLEKLSPQVNSGYDEISPVVTRDGKTLFFTRVGDPN